MEITLASIFPLILIAPFAWWASTESDGQYGFLACLVGGYLLLVFIVLLIFGLSWAASLLDNVVLIKL